MVERKRRFNIAWHACSKYVGGAEGVSLRNGSDEARGWSAKQESSDAGGGTS